MHGPVSFSGRLYRPLARWRRWRRSRLRPSRTSSATAASATSRSASTVSPSRSSRASCLGLRRPHAAIKCREVPAHSRAGTAAASHQTPPRSVDHGRPRPMLCGESVCPASMTPRAPHGWGRQRHMVGCVSATWWGAAAPHGWMRQHHMVGCASATWWGESAPHSGVHQHHMVGCVSATWW
eukprot:gene6005-biopygen8846